MTSSSPTPAPDRVTENPTEHATISVARGEMQPWTDGPVPEGGLIRGSAPAAGGTVLTAVLRDVLANASFTNALIAGPHEPAVVEIVAEHAERVVALRRSPSDAAELAQSVSAEVEVVAGALDGFVEQSEAAAFDLVVIADGLDRLLSTDSPNLDWAQRLELLRSVATDDSTFLLWQGNDLSVHEILDARPSRDRHGDDEWFPLHNDPSRPVSVAALDQALRDAGWSPETTWATFGEPRALGVVDATHSEEPGGVAELLARATRTTDRPLLADPEELIRRASRAGTLSSFADGWLLTNLRGDAAALYCETDVFGSLIVAEHQQSDWVVRTSAPGSSPATDSTESADTDVASALVATAPGLVAPGSVLHAPRSVAAELSAHAEAEDVPAFRNLAEKLGRWWPTGAANRALDFSDVHADADTFTPGWSQLAYSEVDPEASLCAAWWLLHDDLIDGHRRQPWPPWTTGEPLVGIWLGMSGIDADGRPELLARGRAMADELARCTRSGAPAQRDARTALADMDQSVHDLMEARGQIFGLERTIGFRDKQLHTREQRIRDLRKRVAKVERLKATPAYKLAKKARKVASSRDPKVIAKAGKSLLKKAAARVRR